MVPNLIRGFSKLTEFTDACHGASSFMISQMTPQGLSGKTAEVDGCFGVLRGGGAAGHGLVERRVRVGRDRLGIGIPRIWMGVPVLAECRW